MKRNPVLLNNKIVKVLCKVIVKHELYEDLLFFDFDLYDIYPTLIKTEWFKEDVSKHTQVFGPVELINIETSFVDVPDTELLNSMVSPAEHFTIN